MLSGSCLCGRVAYEVDASPGPIVHCHCVTCRKTHGSAFSTVTNVPRNRFRWTKGEDLLKGFESAPGKTRYFCSQCGSHIVAAREGMDTVLLRMGGQDALVLNPQPHPPNVQLRQPMNPRRGERHAVIRADGAG